MIGLDKSSVEEPAQLAERVKALMGEFQNLIEQSLRQAVQPVSELIYKQCQKNLEPFNGVPAKYRMTNKEMPTTPSNFVWNIFYPLNQFIQNNRLEGQVKRVVEFNVVNKIYDKFVLIAREILDTVQKAESVLSKYVNFIYCSLILTALTYRNMKEMEEAEKNTVILSKLENSFIW